MKNFLKGYGSVLSISPSTPAPKISIEIHPRLNEQADKEAFKKDLEAVAKDMWGVIDDESKQFRNT